VATAANGFAPANGDTPTTGGSPDPATREIDGEVQVFIFLILDDTSETV